MILCLDVGNTQIHGGLFKDDELQFQFRKTSSSSSSSDASCFPKTYTRHYAHWMRSKVSQAAAK
ncbi:MAG: hypothetical protein MJK18_01325, partial [Bdellovibrionales bacterium]|nr:hypothetical protein [Bdellovibrionales bacterium]